LLIQLRQYPSGQMTNPQAIGGVAGVFIRSKNGAEVLSRVLDKHSS